jgi:phosphoglycerol transferase
LPKNPATWLFFLCFAAFVLMLLRNTGLQPSIFHDEYTYSTFSRLHPLSEAPIPGYLYLWIYSFTNRCGDGFLECARIFNALFFTAGAIFIFLTARKVASGPVAVLAAAFAIFGPLGIYTVYFMPESLYFLGFWIFVWKLMDLNADSGSREWLLTGFLFGCLSLIKPHSLLLIPAVAVYIWVICREQDGGTARRVKNLVSFGAATAAAKFPIAFLFAGKAGFTIFGPFYNQFADRGTQGPDVYLKLLEFASLSLAGHIMIVALLYGVPLFIAVSIASNSAGGGENAPSAPLKRISLFAVLVALNLILATAAFTGLASSNSEDKFALHMRYYNFALPLFYIVAGAAMSAKSLNPNLFSRLFLALLTGLAAWAACTLMSPFLAGYLHSPEFYTLQNGLFPVFAAMSIFTLGLCFRRADRGTSLYFCLLAPLFVLSSFDMIEKARSGSLVPEVADRAGLFARNYLSGEERDKLVILGSDIQRAAFHVDSPGVVVNWTPGGWKRGAFALPPEKEWILFVGVEPPPGDFFSEAVPMNGFTLARIAGRHPKDKPAAPGEISR